MATDIGAAAIGRATALNAYYTLVAKDNPANGTDPIASVEIWMALEGENVEVATFSASGDNLTTRDSEALGTVVIGSKQTFSGLTMDVSTGDYIGIYGTVGDVEAGSSGGAGVWYHATEGDYIPCTSEGFDALADYIISLYGESAVVGWTGTVMGVTNPAKIYGVEVANIASVMGVS